MSTLAVMWEDVRSIPGAVPTQRRHSRVTTQDFRRDLLRHLIDYRPAGFRFARFKDEIIDVEIDGVRYECFGRCNYGVFLIADDGAVRFRSTSPAHTDDQEWFPANRDLRAFVKCYSAFISSVFQVAAHFDEDTADQAERQATILEHWIRAVDVDALCADAYWTFRVALLAENDVSISRPMVEYMQADRFLVAEAPLESRVTQEEARLTDRH